MNNSEVRKSGGVYLSEITGDIPKRGIAPQDWEKVLEQLKSELSEKDYKIAEGILYKYHTRYV